MIVRISTDLPLPDPPTKPEDLATPHIEVQVIEHHMVAECDHEVAHPNRYGMSLSILHGLTFRSRRRTWRTGRRAR